MNKNILLAAAATSLFWFGVSSDSLAAPPEHPGERHELSGEDKAAFTDAHIAALKAGLKLTAAQEKNWPAFEAVLRDVAKARAARVAEWRERAKEHLEHPNLIEGLKEGANALTARAGEMEKIADAAKPLYDSLDDAQKRRFGLLFHVMARMQGHMGRMRHMMRPTGPMDMGEHPDDHEDAGHDE
jgi:zinc resistance-associated protein